jgi:hypothetical protein
MNSSNGFEKKNSLKINFPPGGNSNFSLGWNKEGTQATTPRHQRSNSKTNFNIVTGQDYTDVIEKENYSSNIQDFRQPQYIEPVKKTNAIKTDYNRSQFNIFYQNNNLSNQQKQQSIKVGQAPGGQSSVHFGDDSRNYDEYRRKK